MEIENLKSVILEKLKQELPTHFKYHNVRHVEDVFQSATHLAKSESIPASEFRILLTAALFHDLGFIRNSINHEKHSCDLAGELLPSFGYNVAEVQRIQELIMATEMPQNPKSELAKILCDADLDYLGRSDFWTIGNGLFEELLSINPSLSIEEWNQKQIQFLKSHSYFTATSQALRNQGKAENLAQLIAQNRIVPKM